MHRVIAVLLAGGAPLAAAQQASPPSSPPADTIVLALPALVSTALRQNLDLRAAELGPRLAISDFMLARGGFDPNLTFGVARGGTANDGSQISTLSSASGTATVATTLPVGSALSFSLRNSSASLAPFAVSSTQPFPNTHASSLGLSIDQPLLRGFGRSGTYGAVDAAALALGSARSRYDRSADITVAAVEHAYWTLRQAEANESVLQQSAATARAIYERNVALQARDVATPLDVLTSERGLATRETAVFDATRQRVDAADRLLFLVYGEEVRGGILLRAARVHTTVDSVVVPSIPLEEDAEQLALGQRADAVAAARDVEAANRRAEQARNQRLPKFDLIASYGYGGFAPANRFLTFGDSADLRSSTWTLGFSTSLFEHNDAARAADERAQSALDLSRMSRVAVENGMRADVRAAVRALQTGRDRYLRAGDVGRLAEREYAAAREGARLGLISTFQLLQYEDQLAQARLLVAQARFALEDAGTQYRLAVGEGRRIYGSAPAGQERQPE